MRWKANNETLVANINIFVQQSTSKWRRRLAKSQLGIGDKDRRQRKSYLFVLPPLHCSGYTTCVRNPYGFNKEDSFCKFGPKKNNTNIQILSVWNSGILKIPFSVFRLLQNKFCSDPNVGWSMFLWYIWFHRWIKLMVAINQALKGCHAEGIYISERQGGRPSSTAQMKIYVKKIYNQIVTKIDK